MKGSVYILLHILLMLPLCAEFEERVITDKEKKKAIVECANSHLESCEALLNSGVPELSFCNVRTECEFVGWLYAQVQNYTQSLPYLQKACNNNHKEGCDKLGFSYQRLNDYKKAKKYYKIACDKNSMSGCYNLAMLYYDGLGVRHSYEMANYLYKKICDNREGIGCLHLGLAYVDGNGVLKNIAMAVEYFKKGCELGNNQSCNLLDAYIIQLLSSEENIQKNELLQQ